MKKAICLSFLRSATLWTGLSALILSPSVIAEETPKKSPAPAKAVKNEIKIPEDLLQDEHLREEFGLNANTAPSIKKIFTDLAEVGPLDFEKLKRPVPKEPARDRVRVALNLGGLIADGFLIVQTEQLGAFEDVGRSVLKHARALGAGDRVSQHTKTILENSTLGDWDILKEELAKTQADVEAEMLLLRDDVMVQIISLGGWLRALEMASQATLDNFSDAKAKKFARFDLVEYYRLTLQELPSRLRDQEPLKTVMVQISAIYEHLEKSQDRALTPADIEMLKNAASTGLKAGTEGK
jgi:hypothetical protein